MLGTLRASFALLSLSSLLVLPLWSQVRSVAAARAAKAPVIDGVIDPKEWLGAARLEDFIQFEPQNGAPATQKTVGYLLYDDEHIYIAVHAYDTDPASITGQLTNRDDDLTKDDSITIYLDSFHDRRSCYYFATNPLATQTDGRIKNDGKVTDRNWDAEWLAAAMKVDDGWMAEFAIPFRVLQFRSGQNRTWGLNIGRSRRANLGRDFWSGPMESPSRVSQFGEVSGLMLTTRAAKRWDFIPFVLGTYRQGVNTTGKAGFDFRYAFSPETTTHLTVNPDFAIIEADREFVNLTRFEVRLDEKRPFFLESNDRFRQRIQTFYSRRIGDIDVGGNLLSRQGGWDLTLLSVRSAPLPVETGDPGADPVFRNANYTVARAERQILKSSTVAFMASNRYLDGGNQGSVGADTTLHLSRTVNFTGQVVRAHGPYSTGNWAIFLRPARDTATSHVHFRYTNIGEHFADNANATGFIRDDDRQEMDSDLEKTFWFEKRRVQRVTVESKNNIYWSQQDVLRSYHNIGNVEVEFRNRWSVEAEYRNDFKLFEKGFHNDTAAFAVGYNTREFQSWKVEYVTGKNFDSDLDAISAEIRRKITPQLSLEYQLERVWLEPDPENEATWINVFRARQSFNRDLFLRVFYQTNSVIDRRNLEVVFVWRYKPPFGSVQFAFQRGRAEFGQRSQQGNTYFLKLQHVF